MSFYSPVIVSTTHEFTATAKNAINNEFIVGPFSFSRREKYTGISVIFDLPSNLTVCINGTTIPSLTFDYCNPLLIDQRILEKIEFYQHDTNQRVDNFECMSMASKIFASTLNKIVNSSIYYPPNFIINYKNMELVRSGSAKQICDIISQNMIITRPPVNQVPIIREIGPADLFNAFLAGFEVEVEREEDEEDPDEPYDGQEL